MNAIMSIAAASAPRGALAAGVVVAAALGIGGCDSHPAAGYGAAPGTIVSSPAASGSTGSSTSATASGPTASGSAATPAATTAAPATSSSATGGTSGTAQLTCAQQAAGTYLQLTRVQAAPDGVLTLTAQPTKMICGGLDDFHFQNTGSTVTAHTTATVSIEIFPIPQMRPEPIQPGKLAAYLATDEDTRIFEVTGPLSAITSLQERFHP